LREEAVYLPETPARDNSNIAQPSEPQLNRRGTRGNWVGLIPRQDASSRSRKVKERVPTSEALTHSVRGGRHSVEEHQHQRPGMLIESDNQKEGGRER